MQSKNINFLIQRKKYTTLAMMFLSFLLILIVGFRPLEYFKDTESYLYWINTFEKIFEREPTFWAINQFNQMLGGDEQIFFLLYAILGVGIKVYVINKHSITPFLSLFAYIAMFIILQDMTQIRAGVAVGILFLAINDIVLGKRKSFIIKVLVAGLFHYSALIMIFIYFLSPARSNIWFYILLPFFGMLISLTSLPIDIIYSITPLLPESISVKIRTYLELHNMGMIRKANPFVLGNFFILSLYYFNIYFMVKKESFNNYYILCTKLLGFGFFVLFAFSYLEVFAYRLSNMLFFSLVFLLPVLIKYFKPRLFVFFMLMIFLTYLFLIHGLNSLAL